MRTLLLFVIGLLASFQLSASTPTFRDSVPEAAMEKEARSIVAGYHIGVLQPLFRFQNNELTYLSKRSFYTIGMPAGITLRTSGRLLIDLEFVPIIKPYGGSDQPIEVHMLYHPGFLMPLGDGFTIGLRLAFETGVNQIGGSLIFNKAWKINDQSNFFAELVMPGRYGPEKDSAYSQVVAVHLGLCFR